MSRTDQGAKVASAHNVARSGHWPAVEKAHLAKSPRCAACAPHQNPEAKVQVHHIFPFHYCVALGRPDLELDDRNLITLCETEQDAPAENHHLLIGHLDSFQSSNLDVSDDAAKNFHGKTAAEIQEHSPSWKTKVANRLKPLSEMTDEDKKTFTHEMNTRFPLQKKITDSTES